MEVAMRPVTKAIIAVLLGFVVVSSLISCASTPKTTGKNFIGDDEKNLQEGPKGGANERWLNPDSFIWGKKNP